MSLVSQFKLTSLYDVRLLAAAASEPETTNWTTESHVYILTVVNKSCDTLWVKFTYSDGGAERSVDDQDRWVDGGQTEQDAQQSDEDLNRLKAQTHSSSLTLWVKNV